LRRLGMSFLPPPVIATGQVVLQSQMACCINQDHWQCWCGTGTHCPDTDGLPVIPTWCVHGSHVAHIHDELHVTNGLLQGVHAALLQQLAHNLVRHLSREPAGAQIISCLLSAPAFRSCLMSCCQSIGPRHLVARARDLLRPYSA
jgi:hypothetical protein